MIIPGFGKAIVAQLSFERIEVVMFILLEVAGKYFVAKPRFLQDRESYIINPCDNATGLTDHEGGRGLKKELY
jgi:hypothetical protein